jgi:lysophospholipase L1-like esterase
MLRAVAVAAAGAAAALAAAAPAVLVPAADPRIRVVGRRLPAPGGAGALLIDWEGTFAQFTVANATAVSLVFTDASEGGARFGVTTVTLQGGGGGGAAGAGAGDPDPHAAAIPGLRTSIVVTTAGTGVAYPIGTRTAVGGLTATFTATLLTEPNFVGDVSPNATLAFDGVLTDGVVLPAPPAAARRMEIVGDSLTAGYGAGFDDPGSPPAPCGGGVLVNDVQNTYGALLCANFSADCVFEAVSGITLFTGRPTLPETWAYELGSMVGDGWAAARVPANTSRFVPDAILTNLGENDWGGGNCGASPKCVADFTAAYVAWVKTLSAAYGDDGAKRITYFATIGPHERGQSAGILPAVAQLAGEGYRVTFLNATVDQSLYPPGCGGHPGPTIHRASFLAARPVIAAVMGW